jgi:hypothetical protein
MVMRDGEQLGLPRLEPICGRSAKALAAMAVAAAVVKNAKVRTILTALDVTAEYRGATYFYRGHHTALGQVDVIGIGGAPCLAMAPKNVRDL